jgi:siroheme synthase (precorrin-2 oxidase/ferrochelatase)
LKRFFFLGCFRLPFVDRPAPPPVDAQIEEHMSAPSEVLEKAADDIQNFKENFSLQISQQVQEKDNRRRFWSEVCERRRDREKGETKTDLIFL